MDENEKTVKVELAPSIYNVKVTDVPYSAKPKTRFRDFCLCIIAIALICLAVPAVYDFGLVIKANQMASNVPSTSEDNISQAKNTIYEKGVVGVMISNFQSNTKWSYFTSNTGHGVVDAEGVIPNLNEFLTLTKNSNRISYFNRVEALDDLSASDVSRIEFKFQFIKNIGSIYETEYNHYSVNTADLTVFMNDGTKKDIDIDPDSLFDYIEAYLQDPSRF